jgi:stage V sporulation protein B
MGNTQLVRKGSTYLFIARIVFLLSGYVTTVFLARFLGPNQFGLYSIVTSLVFIISVVLVTSVQQTTSKFVSEQPKRRDSIKYQLFILQALVAALFFLLYFLLSPTIAALLNDSSLVPYIRYTALLIITNSLFVLFLGYLNGTKDFKGQGLLESLYLIMKALIVMALVLFGFSVYGAITGFILAALISLAWAIYSIGLRSAPPVLPIRKVLKFGTPIFLLTGVSLLLMNLDLFFLKAQSSANTVVGYYVSALQIARIPYYIVPVLSLIAFPLISESTHRGRTKLAAVYVGKVVKYSTIVLVFMAFVVAATSSNILQLLFGVAYLPGSAPLAVLMFGLSLFALYMILTTIISAAGRPRKALHISLVCLAVDIVLLMLLVPRYQMLGAAYATSATMVLGVVMAGFSVWRRFKVLLRAKEAGAVLLAGLVCGAIAVVLPVTGIILVPFYALLAGIYIATLSAMRVLTDQEWQFFKKKLEFLGKRL